MTSSKRFALAACLSSGIALLMGSGAWAETTAAPSTDKPAAAATTSPDKKMSDAEKRAKATDCSKKADAKKLHGEARRVFRDECKKG